MLHLYDDAAARQFEPFALTRPGGELRVGARLIRERWQRATGAPATGFVSSAHLADFEEADAPAATVTDVPAGSILANTRFAPRLAPVAQAWDALECGGRVAAVRLREPLPLDALAEGEATLDALAEGLPRTSTHGWWIDDVWDLIGDLELRLTEDLLRVSLEFPPVMPELCAVYGKFRVHAARDSIIEPFVTFDCTGGPVVVESGARIYSHTRIQGPMWIGPHSIVGGDRISVSAIGPHCKVHGEASNNVFLGYANKSHDGFLGQSYLGRWVNLGANTVTSNLKNTYGPVALWTPRGTRDTGMQFLGSFFGDHAKTGIGMTLTTGSIIGAGAQIFGAETQPKVVPPFAWGSQPPYDTFELDKFLDVAERVMERRHVVLTQRMRAQLTRAFEHRWSGEA